ncbi:MAG: ABC transporter permease subunit [Actinomycetota bacterium]|nr:ABC transporter permease subunit [Actinomycetota bacterium]
MTAGGGLTLLGLLVGAIYAAPFAYLVVRNLALGGELLASIRSPDALGPLANTLRLSIAVAGAAAVVGTGLAWLLVRTDLPLRRLWRALAPLPLVIPSFVAAAALLAAFAPGGLADRLLAALGLRGGLPHVDGFWGAFAVLTLLTYPYVYFPVVGRLMALNPSLEEGARLLGSRSGEVFRRVVLPQAADAIWAGSLLVFLYVVSDFGAVQLLRFDTLTRAIYSARLLDRPTSLALSLILAVVALIVVAAERMVTRRMPTVEVASPRPPVQVRLGGWVTPALLAVVLITGMALLAPVLVLGHWAWRGRGGAALLAQLGELAGPAANTLVVSVLTAVLAVVLVLPVAYLAGRAAGRMGRIGALAGAMVVAGFAIPGLVIALAIVFWALRAPVAVYQTLPLLVLAYLVHFGAHAMEASRVAVAGLPGRMSDAARTLGATRARRLLRVELPLMVPGLLAGGGLVLLSVMKELPATLLLAPIGFQTLATKVWGAATEGFLAETGVASLVLVALSGVVTWWLVVRRARLLP